MTRDPERLGPLVKRPMEITLFRYSAATWNAHRLHYDQEFSRSEGASKPLVQAYLFGAYLSQLVQDWAGPGGQLRRLDYRTRRPVPVGTEVVCTGRVVESANGVTHIELAVHAGDEQCVEGVAEVAIPAD
jgi:hydroxyacyl-ACP dehydratase HTD2-like protein with hotdog domain